MMRMKTRGTHCRGFATEKRREGEKYPHAVYDEAPDFLGRVKDFFESYD